MPVRPGEALIKVTLNLFSADVIRLRHDLGHGYSTWIRDLIHDKLRLEPPRQYEAWTPAITEDLDDGK